MQIKQFHHLALDPIKPNENFGDRLVLPVGRTHKRKAQYESKPNARNFIEKPHNLLPNSHILKHLCLILMFDAP